MLQCLSARIHPVGNPSVSPTSLQFRTIVSSPRGFARVVPRGERLEVEIEARDNFGSRSACSEASGPREGMRE